MEQSPAQTQAPRSPSQRQPELPAPSGRLARIDKFQRGRPWLAIPVATIKKFGFDNGSNLAAVLAFYGFFSIFPLLLVFVTILGFVLAGDPSALKSVEQSVLGEFPVIGDSIKSDALQGSVSALVIGVLLTLYSGLGVTGSTRHALDVAWDVPRKERAGWISSKLDGLALLVILGVLFVVASGASGFVTAGLTGPLLSVAGILSSVLLNFCLFIASFKLLSSASPPWRALLPGAVIAAALWEVLQLVGAVYINHIKHSDSAYGVFALVLGILAWLRIGAQMTMFCVELNTVLDKGLWPWPLTGDGRPKAIEKSSAPPQNLPS